MTIDLDKWKGKQLDGATLAEVSAAIEAHAETLEARTAKAEEKARKAEKESIEGRKTLKAERDSAFEKLGIESADQLDALPDAKGMADAAKQFEAKVKRLERDLAEKGKAFDEMSGRYATERRDRTIAQAVAKHPFIDADDARAVIDRHLQVEGDELRFKTQDGKLTSVDEGVAWIAKTKLHLVRGSAPGQGAGNGGGDAGSQGGSKAMTRAAFESLPPDQRMTAARGGLSLTD